MDVVSFLNSIYLGDRSITGFEVDTRSMLIKIQIDLISRIRSKDGNWDFYSDEDIPNGKIVFRGCSKFYLDSQGILPNDFVEIIEVNKICDDEYKIVFDASQYDFSQKKLIPIKIKIYFSEVYLENASGKIIRN